MKKALIVGGSNGIGLAIAHCLSEEYSVTIIDKVQPSSNIIEKINYEPFDLTNEDYSIFDKHQDINILMITAGFGHLALFKDIDESLISTYFHVNAIPVIRLIKRFYSRLEGKEDFYCGVMVSISGFMSSPFFSVYGATKAALKIFIESVNVELEKEGSSNRILNISSGSIKGTHFDNGTTNDLNETKPLAQDIINHLLLKDDLFIPHYNDIFAKVLQRYNKDFRAEGIRSYEFKLNSGRVKLK